MFVFEMKAASALVRHTRPVLKNKSQLANEPAFILMVYAVPELQIRKLLSTGGFFMSSHKLSP